MESQCFSLHVGLHFFHFNLICNITDLMTPGSSVCVRTEHLLPWFSMLNSLKFDMQHDYVLKKLNFYLLSLPPGSGKIFATMLLHASLALI